jgi:hypothetical protein
MIWGIPKGSRAMLRLLALARGKRMYRIWYWATVDRESDGRFIASIPPSVGFNTMSNRERKKAA